MDLLSHFLDSSTRGVNPTAEPSGYQSKRDNPDLVSRPIVNRYWNARANNMHDDVSLQAFRDKVLVEKLAKSLDRNYRELLSRTSKIAAWSMSRTWQILTPKMCNHFRTS